MIPSAGSLWKVMRGKPVQSADLFYANGEKSILFKLNPKAETNHPAKAHPMEFHWNS